MKVVLEEVKFHQMCPEFPTSFFNQVRKLLSIKNDYEITKILGIPNSTFYRYKSKIYKEDKELWTKVIIEPLESRALKIYEILEECSQINRNIASNEKAKPMDRIKASKRMVNAQYNILRLLKMGPDAEYFEIV